MKYLVLAVISCQIFYLSADGKFDENVALQDIGESQKIARPLDRWMEVYQRHPWWNRPTSRRKKNKKSKGGVPKRLQQNQYRRRMHTSRNDFHPNDDESFGQMADLISSQRHRDEEKTVSDPQRIRIRIRLRQRGPVKRHAKQGKKKSKKVLMKSAQKLATQEAMAMILKNFLRNDKNGVSSRKSMRKSAKGYRRVGQFVLHGKGRRRMKVRTKKRNKSIS